MVENDAGLRIVPGKSESEIAKDLKARIIEQLKPVCTLMDEAAEHGLAVQWGAIAPAAPFFKHQVHDLKIVKSY